ncbi:NADPH dehydrogenase [Coniochaeta ligniaria NRRL 30616]|uniref:NADPH dehydrogenase n=1 Tax=Coniochaeta ligniaria NRRL 30616 TaxID=1408157 RepID=A0A1J7I927_9PEZI|nr:NADPH dehydrogenase [Coniochaeta ligniaria NRRL 30616]
MAVTDLKLAKPITLPCGLTLPNRLVKAAMTEQMADKDKLPDETFNKVYSAWAEGGWGMVLTGNVQVNTTYLGGPDDTAISSQIPEAQLLESWTAWAKACNARGTPTVVQINHPGRQSPYGAGARGFFDKNLAPSPVPLKLGDGILQSIASALIFGTPRAMTVAEIRETVDQFANAARLAAKAGFAGVEIHAAHGYLLAQFLSSQSNQRTDDYGGSPTKQVRIVVEIIKAIREATPEGFCVGIKLNSVDHQSKEALDDCMVQLDEIRKAGVDFLEISGGTYENPSMFLGTVEAVTMEKSGRSKKREAFFLEFSRAIREKFRDVPLMVTGGFRTRLGMEAALEEDACDMIGIGRPAVLNPALPNNVIFNKEIADEDAKVYAKKIEAPWLAKKIGGTAVGAGVESSWYSKQMKELAAPAA